MTSYCIWNPVDNVIPLYYFRLFYFMYTTQILILINLKYSVKRLVVLSTLKVESEASQFFFLYISLTIERTPFFFNSLTHNSLNPIFKICPRTLQQVDSYRYWFNCLTQNETLHIMYSRQMDDNNIQLGLICHTYANKDKVSHSYSASASPNFKHTLSMGLSRE